MLVAVVCNNPTHVDTPPSLPLRDKLRQATDAAHRSLDAQFGRFDLTSLGGYRRFLSASAAALLPLEAALGDAGVARIMADWPRRSRRAAILSDLARLDALLPPLCDVPALSRTHALGVLYVLEGSRLGAKFLLRALEGCRDPVIAGATSYLAHGAGERLWPTFLEALERQSVTPDAEADVIAGAQLAFATFRDAATRA